LPAAWGLIALGCHAAIGPNEGWETRA
jgi:hypothetical protein